MVRLSGRSIGHAHVVSNNQWPDDNVLKVGTPDLPESEFPH